MSRNVFITGTSSGLGLALARAALQRGDRVFGMQRRSSPLASTPGFVEVLLDLAEVDSIAARLRQELAAVQCFDLVVLNAGMLTQIQDMVETPMDVMDQAMKVNAWANKAILDGLFLNDIGVDQVVGISSGAAVSGNRGWNAYGVSKAAFLMLLKLYAAERPQTHFCSFAPGLVNTAMQDYLCELDQDTAEKFPAVGRIQAARDTPAMPRAEQVAASFLDWFDELRSFDSGSFVDVRQWKGEALRALAAGSAHS